MLPSKAKVGDTVHFAFPAVAGKAATAFEVTINGRRVDEPQLVTQRAPGGNVANFVYHVREPGTFHISITPLGPNGDRWERRLHTLEVTTDVGPVRR